MSRFSTACFLVLVGSAAAFCSGFLGQQRHCEVVPAVSGVEQAVRVVLGVVFAGEEHHQAPTHRVLDTFHNRGDAGQAEKATHAHQGHHRVGRGLGNNRRLDAFDQAMDELDDLSGLIAGEVLCALSE